jgi:hypothetical protein
LVLHALARFPGRATFSCAALYIRTHHHCPHFTVVGEVAHDAGKLHRQAIHAAHRAFAHTQGGNAPEYAIWDPQLQLMRDWGSRKRLFLRGRAVSAKMLPPICCIQNVEKVRWQHEVFMARRVKRGCQEHPTNSCVMVYMYGKLCGQKSSASSKSVLFSAAQHLVSYAMQTTLDVTLNTTPKSPCTLTRVPSTARYELEVTASSGV